uniref:Short chain dehydrogenase ple7 n=1 Tax=Rhodocybe pseudopiperita TaxID=693819 RepID=PLE7_RHOPP|nr:RecName: Full=Short chain dehydrogenase ple7; AltName: Full=Pleuromutilin biosynthesis cluster protein 7 [Rhodocybe pseudopiperita]BCI98775.1 putative short chain dehydrogenase [Rhodocybe pseudopiperita]
MEGKIVIVTGASHGIGLATVNLLLAAGASVFGVDLAPTPPSVTSEKFKFLQLNICDKDAPAKIVLGSKDAFGSDRIDALLNVAGISDYFQTALTFEDDVWDSVIDVNLAAQVRLMREVLKVMKVQKSGSIVNVVSKLALSGACGGVAYVASKHALLGVTKNTAWMFKDDGIRCNAVAPGSTDTNIRNTTDATKIDYDAFTRAMPVIGVHCNLQTGEGMMSPEPAAQAIFFLASDLSKGMNGVVIPVDNAWSVI